jgi:integrase
MQLNNRRVTRSDNGLSVATPELWRGCSDLRDLDRRVSTISSGRYKMGQQHSVPLTDDAMAVPAALPRFRRGDCLFGERPVNGWSKAKQRIDHHLLRTLRTLARLRCGDPAVAPVLWTNHDIRRTVRSRLSALRVRTI